MACIYCACTEVHSSIFLHFIFAWTNVLVLHSHIYSFSHSLLCQYVYIYEKWMKSSNTFFSLECLFRRSIQRRGEKNLWFESTLCHARYTLDNVKRWYEVRQSLHLLALYRIGWWAFQYPLANSRTYTERQTHTHTK